MGDSKMEEPVEGEVLTPIATTSSLEALQSSEQRELMDLVDRLRRAGLSTLLQLPQIVVCGDQSSGKSSVLEAITEIPFPRKENLCTRFATEISLRRDMVESISCKINPDETRSDDEINRLRDFSRSIRNFDELPSLIDAATEAMGLGPSKAFSRDVLCIEICGPDRPQLTLIDLPGLIHASNKSQSEEDVELIRSLVKEYISKQQTIMLAVVSAKNDYANQIILKMCREFDTKGARTLGIITKPDFLRPGSENESTWLDLARNKDIFFELGWHLLKNRADDQHSISFLQRNLEEQAFFKAGNYTTLPPSTMGVNHLRDRLSQLLFDHLRKALPDLEEELHVMLSKTVGELDILGKRRESVSDQRFFLAELATSASNIIRMGCDGIYEAPFFGTLDIDASVDAEQNFLRLRAVVQHLNMTFAEDIRLRGLTFQIDKEQTPKSFEDGVETVQPWITARRRGSPATRKPVKMRRQQAVTWVKHIQERIRGRELPGVFNPMLIGHMFREQSVYWEYLARKHIDAVWKACTRFVLAVLNSVGTSDTIERLSTLIVSPFFKHMHSAAVTELERVLADKSRHPITYNHYFTDNIQKLQQDRLFKLITESAQQSTIQVLRKTNQPGSGYTDVDHIDPAALKSKLHQTIQHDMDKFAAEQALDAHDAFYKDEQKYFVDVVTKQAIERQLLAPLVEILSPMSMAGFSDEKVQSIASEPFEVRELRAHLESKKKMLEEGADAFEAAVTGR